MGILVGNLDVNSKVSKAISSNFDIIFICVLFGSVYHFEIVDKIMLGS